MTKKSIRKRGGRQDIVWLLAVISFVVILAAVVLFIAVRFIRQNFSREASAEEWDITNEKYVDERPKLDVDLLPENPYSRPGDKLGEVNAVVIHYTANPGTTARQNRDYFAGLAKSHTTSASSHFIIGLDGEIVQCIPCSEIAYASNDRNKDTIAIECCISDESGKFNSKTYQSLLHLTAWLVGRYELRVEDVIRHYDVTGKNCPKYFVEHPSAWEQFHNDIARYIEEHGVKKEE